MQGQGLETVRHGYQPCPLRLCRTEIELMNICFYDALLYRLLLIVRLVDMRADNKVGYQLIKMAISNQRITSELQPAVHCWYSAIYLMSPLCSR